VRHRPLLKKSERDVWRSFLRLHASLTRRLEEELRAETGLSLSALEVLWALITAPDNRLRMTEVADHLVFTRSGVTRLIDRLERDGLVTRGDVDDDLRGRFTVLTPLGFDRFEDGARKHVAALRRLFFAEFCGNELDELRAILDRLERRVSPEGTRT
jgi:DNA-binding MarR family transcriptional regulator